MHDKNSTTRTELTSPFSSSHLHVNTNIRTTFLSHESQLNVPIAHKALNVMWRFWFNFSHCLAEIGKVSCCDVRHSDRQGVIQDGHHTRGRDRLQPIEFSENDDQFGC